MGTSWENELFDLGNERVNIARALSKFCHFKFYASRLAFAVYRGGMGRTRDVHRELGETRKTTVTAKKKTEKAVRLYI